MINHHQLRECVIMPALSKLQLYSKDAEELLVFTCAVESNGGTYLKQIKGPALGIYQMEPATHNDIWQRYIRFHTDLSMMLSMNFYAPRMPDESRLVYDLGYATAMARIHYKRVSAPLPSATDVNAMWEYYKEYYNTKEGKSKKDKSVEAYEKYINQK